LRAALGLMANAVDAARLLPDRAVVLPVLAVSTALQFSLRAQQRYTELTLRGDELLGRLHGPPEEPPSWATFDDEDAARRVPPRADDPVAVADGTAAAEAVPPEDIPISAPTKAAEAVPPEDIPISAPTKAAAAAPVKSPSKQPRARKTPAKKTVAAKSTTKSSTAKPVRAPRQAKPSAFDRTEDE
jgi:hypothetical protein